MGMAGHAAKSAAPAPVSAPAVGGKPSGPAPRSSAPPVRAKVSGLDVGLAFATVACSLATVAILFLYLPVV